MMYKIIADKYEELFPADESRLAFARSILKDDAKVLDIGAGTGGFARILSQNGYRVTAYEPDDYMITEALKKSDNQNHNPFYKKNGMLDLDEINVYDAVFCMGNTLVHLENSEQIVNFFRAVKKALVSDGVFVMQLFNYNKISGIVEYNFDDIELSDLIFKRRYFEISESSLQFEISLYSKSAGVKDCSLMKLYPVLPRDVQNYLKNAGFSNISYYKDYNKTAFKESDTFYLVIAS